MNESYVSPDEADAYHGARPTADRWAAMPSARQEAALTAACDYADVMFGLPPDLVRSMRSGGTVPPEVKKAVCELALTDLQTASSGKAKSISKGGMSADLADDGRECVLQYVRRLLAPLVKRGTANVKIERG